MTVGPFTPRSLNQCLRFCYMVYIWFGWFCFHIAAMPANCGSQHEKRFHTREKPDHSSVFGLRPTHLIRTRSSILLWVALQILCNFCFWSNGSVVKAPWHYYPQKGEKRQTGQEGMSIRSDTNLFDLWCVCETSLFMSPFWVIVVQMKIRGLRVKLHFKLKPLFFSLFLTA